MSANGVTTFFDNVIDQKALKNNEFAFYFNRADSKQNAILWGGVDPALYKGRIRMFPVTQAHYWALDLHDFRIGDESIDFPKHGGEGLIEKKQTTKPNDVATASAWAL